MVGMKFSLAWLFWLATCCALACWLLTLPPIFSQRAIGIALDSSGNVIGRNEEWEPTHWPTEVAGRLAVAALMAIAPIYFRPPRA